MQRIAFDRSVTDGFRTTKVESMVTLLQGRRLFVGTSDGFLTLYECRQDSSIAGKKGYSCYVLESIRKQSKEKKPATALLNIENWRAIVCIIDSTIYAYDSQFYQQLASIPDSKGCHAFAANEALHTLAVANKKKLSHYAWQDSNFQFKREFTLVDVPKTLCCVGDSVVIAYKKFYECLNLNTGGTSRILDVEKEHKMIVVELPASPFRPESVILSLGAQGVVLSTESILSGASFAYGSVNEERIEWLALPTAVHRLNPFLLSLLSDGSVEVHEIATLSSIQRIQISTTFHALSLAVCPYENIKTAPTGSFSNHAYLCNGDQLSVLRMIPLSVQVDALLSSGMYEEAINLCTACDSKEMLADIDLMRLYESSAQSLLAKGDFEKAIQRFIFAQTDFVSVARNFPDLIPLPLHLHFQITPQTRPLAGAVLNRAASAIVLLCEFHRPKISKRADRAAKSRESGIIGSAQKVSVEDEEEEYIADPDEDIRRSQLLDTMFLFALMNCAPVNRPAVIELLSKPNRCHLDSCSVLIASSGNAYAEHLLWLYRSQGQHQRVLQALREDKCVAIGTWTKDQFYHWTADYLRWLWYHDEDASLPRQALDALRPLLEYDAELGLSVLVQRPPHKSSFGGKGVTITEVLNFLRSTSPKRNYARAATSANANDASGVAAIISSTPLYNGHALGVAFLECLVSSGEAPANMHDEFAQLLVEGLPFDNEINVDHSKNDLVITPDDDETMQLYKVYRRKLQNFLASSQEYHLQRVLKFLPRQYLHENALVLSKLGRHREVLKIYLRQLKNPDLGEAYCERIYAYQSTLDANKTTPGKSNARTNVVNTLSSAGEIYLIMFQVVLGEEDDEDDIDAVEKESRLRAVIRFAEKYFDRFDTNAFLELLPRKNVTVTMLLKFMQLVLEYQSTKKRNLQIAHQLLRTKEVKARTKGVDLKSTSDR